MANEFKDENNYQQFINEKADMPVGLQLEIKNLIVNKMNVHLGQLVLKTISLQLIAGLIILSFCPQMGVGFNPDSHFAHLLMSFGHNWCNLFCGFLFIGTSFLLSPFIFQEAELQKLQSLHYAFLPLLILISILSFIIAGAPVILPILISWALGAYLGGFLFLTIGVKINHLKFST